MAQTLFKRVDTTVEYLVAAVDQGVIGLPDIQRPFVWSTTKVRDLFDSMFRGYPVGYLLQWANPEAPGHIRQIGTRGHGQDQATTLIIDGQQRLTSLYAVMKGKPVMDKNFQEKRIGIGFNPLQSRFEVASAPIRRSPEWIADISEVFISGASAYGIIEGFLRRLAESREVSDKDKDRVATNIEQLLKLRNYPFSALEISADADEEQVADIFVRVNSKGQNLKQADFILTLLSVFWEEGRAELEDFAKRSRIPPKSGDGPSPFNHHIEPDPDQLLRVGVAVGLRRARLKYAYQFLRGKDVETGTYTTEIREANLVRLKKAQSRVLNLTRWHEYLTCLVSVGFRSGRQISSKIALLYCYTFFLIGRDEYHVDPAKLRRLIGRLFLMVTLTGRYSGSPESVMEEDLARLRGVETPEQFTSILEKLIDDNLTHDFWEISLPNELETSSTTAAVHNAYHAAQNIIGARALFSTVKVSELMDPTLTSPRSALELHHLFPKGFLKKIDITAVRETNQIANYALIEWGDNNAIKDRHPAEYVPEYERRFTSDEVADFYRDNALPDQWYHMDYFDFLTARRKLMADVIKRAYERLA